MGSSRLFSQIAWRCGAATRGAARTFGEGLRRSTVAHFACKVRGTNIVATNTAKNPTKICPKALAIFATCSWPSLCKQSELQCWRRNRRLHLSLRRKTTDSLLVSERGMRYDRTWDETRPHAGRRLVVLRPAFAGKYREWSKKRYSVFVTCRCERLTYHLLIVYGSLSVDSCHQFIWC